VTHPCIVNPVCSTPLHHPGCGKNSHPVARRVPRFWRCWIYFSEDSALVFSDRGGGSHDATDIFEKGTPATSGEALFPLPVHELRREPRRRMNSLGSSFNQVRRIPRGACDPLCVANVPRAYKCPAPWVARSQMPYQNRPPALGESFGGTNQDNVSSSWRPVNPRKRDGRTKNVIDLLFLFFIFLFFFHGGERPLSKTNKSSHPKIGTRMQMRVVTSPESALLITSRGCPASPGGELYTSAQKRARGGHSSLRRSPSHNHRPLGRARGTGWLRFCRTFLFPWGCVIDLQFLVGMFLG
jgi:hypothetical protein